MYRPWGRKESDTTERFSLSSLVCGIFKKERGGGYELTYLQNRNAVTDVKKKQLRVTGWGCNGGRNKLRDQDYIYTLL